MPEDQVFMLREGWYCIVAGKVFGPWQMHGYALAGMATEQRRHKARLVARDLIEEVMATK